MLSRHASGIFWLARYLERAEFTAKLARATLSAAPPGSNELKKFLASALLAIGEHENFRRNHASSPGTCELEFLVGSGSNPSSIFACAEQARSIVELNCPALPPELEAAVHELLRTAKEMEKKSSLKEPVEFELLAICSRSAEAHGIAHGRLLRGGAYEYWQTGRMIERVSGIARMVDLGLNLARYMQSENSCAGDSFLLDYFGNFANSGDLLKECGGRVSEFAILNFFILSPKPPTSLAFAVLEIERCLKCLSKSTANAAKSASMANRLAGSLRTPKPELVLKDDFSQFARNTIQAGARLANQIEFDFNFKA
ncbi:MAG: alpha-E domain-containing protein [Albidovulum sp.]|nr:alpha-E domain-containing protein [Albidovulum sp.]